MKRVPGVAKRQPLSLRLYVAAESPNTRRALTNLREICAASGQADVELTVVDVLREPGRALQDGVLVAPTLVKLGPGPARKIVGDLSDRDLVLSILADGAV